jgi:hypothetical protein
MKLATIFWRIQNRDKKTAPSASGLFRVVVTWIYLGLAAAAAFVELCLVFALLAALVDLAGPVMGPIVALVIGPIVALVIGPIVALVIGPIVALVVGPIVAPVIGPMVFPAWGSAFWPCPGCPWMFWAGFVVAGPDVAGPGA